ncbi:uncharacterized protein LOC129755154 [Uranotaenia lowii]|uniref:uncharacterized protein LOC129755154 n=1 Tax=Uranotaenia lowii TaxID=190385 RepID=UPI00247A7EEE|nr:uncharacterized protein LOC129755154 [Uranotaenia lowii]
MVEGNRSSTVVSFLLSPRLYGFIVGILSLWAMLAAISASVYLLVKYDDIREVPESLKPYYSHATVDVVLISLSLVIVAIYMIGIFKANELYLMPFLALLVVDFSVYIVSESIARIKVDPESEIDEAPNGTEGRWKKNLSEIVVFTLMFVTVVHLYQTFKYQRHLKGQSSAGYRSISENDETVGM